MASVMRAARGFRSFVITLILLAVAINLLHWSIGPILPAVMVSLIVIGVILCTVIAIKLIIALLKVLK